MTENSANAVKKVATPYMGPQQADSIIKYMTAELGLKDLYTGFDGEYIRVWLWSSDTTWVLDLWNSPNKNGGSITVSTITEKENDSRNWRSIVCECNDLKPKHGWKQMFDKISKMEISKLPDGDSLIKEIAYLTSPRKPPSNPVRPSVSNFAAEVLECCWYYTNAFFAIHLSTIHTG